jgi:hypothetical protein
VTENVKVKRCVVECVPVVREVEVCRTVYDRVERTGKRRVCEMVKQERVVEVSVVRCEPEERKFKAYECVPAKEKRRVQYCEMVAYEDVIRVRVDQPCESECGRCRLFGGLLARCSGRCD